MTDKFDFRLEIGRAKLYSVSQMRMWMKSVVLYRCVITGITVYSTTEAGVLKIVEYSKHEKMTRAAGVSNLITNHRNKLIVT